MDGKMKATRYIWELRPGMYGAGNNRPITKNIMDAYKYKDPKYVPIYKSTRNPQRIIKVEVEVTVIEDVTDERT